MEDQSFSFRLQNAGFDRTKMTITSSDGEIFTSIYPTMKEAMIATRVAAAAILRDADGVRSVSDVQHLIPRPSSEDPMIAHSEVKL